MSVEELSGALSCDIGSGRLGATLQHDDIGAEAVRLLGNVSDMLSIIVAIFGQCGTHGWLVFVDLEIQQSVIATAGEASKPSNNKRPTSLERIFTTNADLILDRCVIERCDLNHNLTWDWVHLVPRYRDPTM